jgi:hypothetical protein
MIVNLSKIKNWYKSGSIPSDVAIYDDSIINAILSKSNDIDAEFGSFFPELLATGASYTEIFDHFTSDEMHYDFTHDVVHQNNSFEYYKLVQIVDYNYGNDSFGKIISEKDASHILHVYHLYKTLLDQLNSDEKNFFNDVLKLVGGIASAYGPYNDTAFSYNGLTTKIHGLQPLLG